VSSRKAESFHGVVVSDLLGGKRHLESLLLAPDGVLPYGGITEIFGGISSGKTTLAYVVVSSFVRRGELAAWIDLPDAFDPSCARRAGVDLDRVLWVAPSNVAMAVRAIESVLAMDGFRVVILDLGIFISTRSTVSASAWLRLNRVASRRSCAIVVLASAHATGAFSTLSMEANASRRVFVGEDGSCSFFEGTYSALQIRKFKNGPLSDRPFRFFASTTD
jgi:hypothetical protein